MMIGNMRRRAPRVGVEALCSEIVEGRERHGMLVDVSETGLRVARPWFGGHTPRELQIEFELPGIDEIIWARGQVCFDQVSRGTFGRMLRTTGIRLAAAAARDLRILRDYVMDTKRSIDDVNDLIVGSSAFAHG
jgi:hypothetical protein